MASVKVSLIGPSLKAVGARLDEIALAIGADRHPFKATASFVEGAPSKTYEMVSALRAPSLEEAQLRAKLAPFQDEEADPEVAVRFVVLD